VVPDPLLAKGAWPGSQQSCPQRRHLSAGRGEWSWQWSWAPGGPFPTENQVFPERSLNRGGGGRRRRLRQGRHTSARCRAPRDIVGANRPSRWGRSLAARPTWAGLRLRESWTGGGAAAIRSERFWVGAAGAAAVALCASAPDPCWCHMLGRGGSQGGPPRRIPGGGPRSTPRLIVGTRS